MDTIPYSEFQGDISALAALITPNTLILTPNTRLAARLRSELTHCGSDSRGNVHAQADIYPLQQWINRQQRLAQVQGVVSSKPVAKPIEELALWRHVVEASEQTVVNAKAIAKQAQAAAATLALWGIDIDTHRWQFDAEPDSAAFRTWLQQFQRLEAKQAWQSTASLHAGLLRADVALAEKHLLLVGFYDVNPFLQTLFSQAQLCQRFYWQQLPRSTQGIACASGTEEIAAAAQWAKAIVEREPQATIGICVPDLNQRRDEVFAAFEFEFQAESLLPQHSRKNFLFNLSAGIALAEAPLVNALILALKALKYPLSLAEWQQLLFSPFFTWGHSEALQNTLSALQDFPLPEARLGELVVYLGEETVLEPLYHYSKSLQGRADLSTWFNHTEGLIALSQWPGPRTLSSDEYQQHARCIEVLQQLRGYQLPQPLIAFASWFELVADALQQTVFHSQSPPCAVQVLGVLEASGQCFDYLWLCGLQETDWPASLAPNPLIPAALQQEYHMPRGSHQRELDYAKRVLQGFRHGAAELVCSYIASIDEVDVKLTPLLERLETTAFYQPSNDVASEQCGAFNAVTDTALAVQVNETQLSASALVAQSQCPLKAFFSQRLLLYPPNAVSYGLNAAERGALLHNTFEAFYSQYRHSNALAQLSEESLHTAIAAAATTAINRLNTARKRTLSDATLAIEHQRLQRLLNHWLALEANMGYQFEIAALEEPVSFEHAGIQINMRIDRIDSDQGRWLVIDYKSSRPMGSDWYEERMHDPQLPIYAVALSKAQQVCGIAVATVKQFECQLDATGSHAQGVKKPLPEEQWQTQIETWQDQVHTLCEEFSAGLPVATPSEKACRYCAYESLCRANMTVEAKHVG